MMRAHLVFRLGGRSFALPSDRVVRVAEPDRVTPLPGDLASNLGLVVDDGVVAALVDLGALLSRDAEPRRLPEPPFSCVFARFPRGVAGFAVDEISGVRLLARTAGHGDADGIERIDLEALEATAR